MMTRKDTIFEYVKQNASIESEGYTTTEISEALGIIRNNVSKELNVLVREGKLQKSTADPSGIYWPNVKCRAETKSANIRSASRK